MFSHEDYYILSCNLASESEYVREHFTRNTDQYFVFSHLFSTNKFLVRNPFYFFFAECFNLGICR